MHTLVYIHTFKVKISTSVETPTRWAHPYVASAPAQLKLLVAKALNGGQHLVAKALRVDVAAKLNHEAVARNLRLVVGAELLCTDTRRIVRMQKNMTINSQKSGISCFMVLNHSRSQRPHRDRD